MNLNGFALTSQLLLPCRGTEMGSGRHGSWCSSAYTPFEASYHAAPLLHLDSLEYLDPSQQYHESQQNFPLRWSHVNERGLPGLYVGWRKRTCFLRNFPKLSCRGGRKAGIDAVVEVDSSKCFASDMWRLFETTTGCDMLWFTVTQNTAQKYEKSETLVSQQTHPTGEWEGFWKLLVRCAWLKICRNLYCRSLLIRPWRPYWRVNSWHVRFVGSLSLATAQGTAMYSSVLSHVQLSGHLL